MEEHQDNMHLIKDENVKQFVFGGNSTCIVRYRGEQHKLRVNRNKYMDKGHFYLAIDGYYLGTYFAIPGATLDQKTGTPKQRATMQEILDCILYDKIPEDMQFFHVGICGICGRDLTDPYSMYIGIGPTCRKRIGMTK